jgi:hypothetical protein
MVLNAFPLPKREFTPLLYGIIQKRKETSQLKRFTPKSRDHSYLPSQHICSENFWLGGTARKLKKSLVMARWPWYSVGNPKENIMPKFTIHWNASYTAEVEAENEDQAREMAFDLSVDVEGSQYVDGSFDIGRISEGKD